MRHCQTASDYYIDCCWHICFSSAHVQYSSWPVHHYRLAGELKFHIVHAPGNITVPKKCHCTQTKKLLLHLEVRRLSQWLSLAVLFSFTTFRCQPDLSQGFSAGLWVTGNRIIQTSWISLAQIHHHQNCWTKKSTEETIRPCTNKIKVTWPMLGQLKHLLLMIKELYCTNTLYASLYKKRSPNKIQTNPQHVPDSEQLELLWSVLWLRNYVLSIYFLKKWHKTQPAERKNRRQSPGIILRKRQGSTEQRQNQ